MKDIFIIIIILGLLFLYFLFSISINKPRIEKFYVEKKYLYPIRGLQKECNALNLKPSYMPKACHINGQLNSYANCKCQDNEGNCKLCYPTIQRDTKNSNIVYGGDNF